MLWARQSVPSKEKAQRQIKAELLLDGVALLGVDALGPGDGDLAFGLDFLISEAASRGLPYVSANLANREGTLVFPESLVVKRAGLKIGITSVLSDELHVAGGRVLPTRSSLKAVVAKLRALDQLDLVLVLSHLGLTADKSLPHEVPGIDLIFGGHSRSHQEEPVLVGDTAIFQAGSRGKHLGQVTLSMREAGVGWFDPGSQVRVGAQREHLVEQIRDYKVQLAALLPENESKRTRLEKVVEFSQRRLDALPKPSPESSTSNLLKSEKIPLNRGLDDHKEMAVLVDAALKRLGPEGRLTGHEGHNHGHGAATPKPKVRTYGDFVGAEACKACHQGQYKDWSTTRHAHAYATLVKERRHFDLDCWSCHVTGANLKGGPSGPYDVGPMRNVQCESCHGAGRQHVANPSVDMVRVPSEELCKSCHSDEQTEGRFEYSSYLPRVDHVH